MATTWSKRPRAGSSMSPTRKSMEPRPGMAPVRSRASPIRVGETSMATTVAPRRLQAESPGAAAGIEDAPTREILGQPGQERAPHGVAADPHGGTDAADRRVRGEARPG